MLIWSLLLSLPAPVSAPAPIVDRYAEGQVWEYRTRPADMGSRVKIQRIEVVPGDPQQRRIYHISLAGVRLNAEGAAITLPHLPVSRETLDASVTRRSSLASGFPSLAEVDEGVTVWRADHGGLFTAPLAEIVAMVAGMIQPPAGTPR